MYRFTLLALMSFLLTAPIHAAARECALPTLELASAYSPSPAIKDQLKTLAFEPVAINEVLGFSMTWHVLRVSMQKPLAGETLCPDVVMAFPMPIKQSMLLDAEGRDVPALGFAKGARTYQVPTSGTFYYVYDAIRKESSVALFRTPAEALQDAVGVYTLRIICLTILCVFLMMQLVFMLMTRYLRYWVYVLYMIGTITWQLFETGLAQEFWYGTLFYAFFCGTMVLATSMMWGSISQFVVSYLDLRKRVYRFWLVVRWMPLLFAGYFCIALWNPVGALQFASIIIPAVASVSVGVTAYLAYQGFKPAWFMLFGWTTVVTGSIINILRSSLVIPGSIPTNDILLVTLVVEAVTLFFGIAYRLQEREVLHAKDQRESIAALRMKDAENAHIYGQMQKLVHPHQLQLLREGYQLEDTMPTSASEACVISFDIQGSSRIQHERAKDFIQNVFRRCGEIMMQNYDGDAMVSNAYLIKEMGDGFLCSIGYPFRASSPSMSESSIGLAHDFIRVFMEEVALLDYRDPIRAGIGIALDHIQGYYPKSGTREYDVYGRAIVLATRYESMRKALLKGREDNIIIIQERVYLSCSRDLQASFQVVELSSSLTVRDDPSAQRLYYKIIDATRSEPLIKAA